MNNEMDWKQRALKAEAQLAAQPAAPATMRDVDGAQSSEAQFKFGCNVDSALTRLVEGLSPGGHFDPHVSASYESEIRQAAEVFFVERMEELAPAAPADPIVELNVALLRARSAVGIEKYGTTLADSNLPMRDRLTHALEEALDQANYLQWAIQGCEQAAADQAQYVEVGEIFDGEAIVNEGGWPEHGVKLYTKVPT